jgi:uncharacterized membrane protein YphA (DoxX/SURF4 family)
MIIEIGSGIALILGWYAHWAAAALFVFTFMAAMFFSSILECQSGHRHRSNSKFYEEPLDHGRYAL